MNCDLSVGFIHHLRLPLIPRMPLMGAFLIGAGRIGLGLAIGRGRGLDILIGAGLIGAGRIGAGRIGAGLDGREICIRAIEFGSLRIAPLCFIGAGGLVSRFLGRFTGVPGAFPAWPLP